MASLFVCYICRRTVCYRQGCAAPACFPVCLPYMGKHHAGGTSRHFNFCVACEEKLMKEFESQFVPPDPPSTRRIRIEGE